MRYLTDPHCHIWDLSLGYYQWLESSNSKLLGDLSPIAKNYLAHDFLSDISSVEKFHLRKFVHIESATSDKYQEEVVWLCEVAKKFSQLGAIVAGIDLSNKNIMPLLEFYQETNLVVGVRHIINFHENPENIYSAADQDYLKNKVWLENFKLLEKYNLMFEAQVSPNQLLSLASLAENNPGITININHAGFPIRECFDAWKKGIIQCAKYKNINIKLSGFGMLDRDWSASSIRDIVIFVTEKFGVDRCMFASNFPVDKLYKNYYIMMKHYLNVVTDFPDESKEKLFYKNSERVYCLK